MNTKVACAIAFVAGAAVGVAASWRVLDTKYKKLADKEIASVKELFYSKPVENNEESDESEEKKFEQSPEEDFTEEEKKEYTNIASNYTNYATKSVVEEEPDVKITDIEPNVKITDSEPYVISPVELGDCDYDVIDLIYYEGDNTLTDEEDEIINDVGELIAWESLEHFGEYEDDSVCVRNDIRKVDYEVLLDVRKYSEVMYLRELEEQ